MDADHIAIAESCLVAAHDGTMSFPQIVGRLIAAGFEGYAVDYRRNSQTFYLTTGESAVLAMHLVPCPITAAFDAVGVEQAVRWAQSGAADYSYAGFSQRVCAAGCAGYVVSFSGRRAVYLGRTAETHVEHFPQ